MPSPLWHRVVVVILNQMSDWRNCTFTWRQHWSLNTSYIIMYLTLNDRRDKLFWNTKLLRLWSNLNWPSLTMRKNPVLKHFFTGFPFWPSSYDCVSHIIGWLLCLCLFKDGSLKSVYHTVWALMVKVYHEKFKEARKNEKLNWLLQHPINTACSYYSNSPRLFLRGARQRHGKRCDV